LSRLGFWCILRPHNRYKSGEKIAVQASANGEHGRGTAIPREIEPEFVAS
jgi:hypothetical protein